MLDGVGEVLEGADRDGLLRRVLGAAVRFRYFRYHDLINIYVVNQVYSIKEQKDAKSATFCVDLSNLGFLISLCWFYNLVGQYVCK